MNKFMFADIYIYTYLYINHFITCMIESLLVVINE